MWQSVPSPLFLRDYTGPGCQDCGCHSEATVSKEEMDCFSLSDDGVYQKRSLKRIGAENNFNEAYPKEPSPSLSLVGIYVSAN